MKTSGSLQTGTCAVRWLALGATLLSLVPLATAANAAPSAEQQWYWWQDEIRSVAFAWSRVRSGQVAQWPRMSVPAGTATLPVPRASSAVTVDGRLDEEAWKSATRFPVGPLFDAWQQGPFTVQVAVCRDDRQLYLAIEAPRDVTGLGALTDGEFFTVNKQPYHVGPDGGIPPSSVTRNGEGLVFELALPLAKELDLAFPAELVRRVDGKLPPETAALGLDRLAEPAEKRANYRSPWLWLEPIAIRLLPADVGVRLSWTLADAGNVRLNSAVMQMGQTPATADTPLSGDAEGAVYRYSWSQKVAGGAWSAEGLVYVEPVVQTLAAIRELQRKGNQTQTLAASSPDVTALLEAEAQRAARSERRGWRELYCRARALRAQAHLRLLAGPLLFVKQHPYFAAHIYDDFYPWHPGGGIYVLENPADSPSAHRLRPVLDATTAETLGAGIYRDVDLSWDARQIVFACRPTSNSVTSIYTIGLDGRGLKRLTASDKFDDIQPAWMADDRIVFISTRPRALVPCFNSGVGTLHTMNADGSELRSVSGNNVTEFDPAVLEDGRILYGRWEYVDKTALYMQSLWTMSPDGRMEESLFKNNIPKPTAVLDPKPVPGSHQVVASLTPHNGQAVGAIGLIDTHQGKNDLNAVFNFTPEYPVEMDQGLAVGPCDPCPLSEDEVLISNNAVGAHGVLELLGRDGSRDLVYCDPAISCFAPTLVKPRARPAVVTPHTEPNAPGRFLVVDIYQGLTGVERGTIKALRVVEETARTSGIPPGGRWWNQAFLVSWQGAYIVKNILGVVPVHEDGSAYFEAPPGRAIYFEALDGEGREIQRMRTFVQAAPGVTRSCIGCHESKKSSPPRSDHLPLAMRGPPAPPQPESWGSGYIDYPSMVQPILDKYCVRCHGGPEGLGKGLDFTGGWTWAFNISYETLLKHRLTGFLNCNNGSVHTSQILPPRTIGSGAAPLAEIFIKKHPEVTRAERDLMLAWMDTNSNYYGTWDYTPHATCDTLLSLRGPLTAAMSEAGCLQCHAPNHIGNDWVNLQTPEWSRILRAPMPIQKGGLGLAMCRNRKARVGYPLVDQNVQPPDVFLPSHEPSWDASGQPQITISATSEPAYQALLAIIRRARATALARPRVDMPGAVVEPGQCRMQVPLPVPDAPPSLTARLRPDDAVELSWPRTAETIGLQYELHRGTGVQFAPTAATQIALTTAGRFADLAPAVGQQHYALVVTSGAQRSRPVWAALQVPQPKPPLAPRALVAQPFPGEVVLSWEGLEVPGVRYVVQRTDPGAPQPLTLTAKPVDQSSFSDFQAAPGARYVYSVRAIDRRGQESPPSASVAASPLPEIKEPTFATDFAKLAEAVRLDGSRVRGQVHRGAKVTDGALEFGADGFVTFEAASEFELRKAFSCECWLRIDKESSMPVIAAAGEFSGRGWFLQRYGGAWRWHLAPVSCDGGQPVVGRWTHLIGTFDGARACLYQDGKLVAQTDCVPNREPWRGPLVLGQYSQQAPSFQVQGGLKGLKLYARALRAAEVAEKFRAGR